MTTNLRLSFIFIAHLLTCIWGLIVLPPPAQAQNHPQQETSELLYNNHIYSDHNVPNHAAPQSGHSDTIKEPKPVNSFRPKTATLSTIEKMYAERITGTEKPEQFGYSIFGFNNPNSANTQNQPIGALGDDFTLGTGDELLITFTGQRTEHNTYKVDSRGYIIIRDLPPIPAAGRTLNDIQTSLTHHLSGRPNIKSYVSLANVRQINVLIIGHVNSPGKATLSALSNIIDALNTAQGISKDGSLRQIKRIRAGRSTTIDLYTLLLNNAPASDLTLKDGDRLIIPPIGPSMAIEGAVKRPGIYELKANTPQTAEKLSLKETLTLAGGELLPGQSRFIHISPGSNGQENVSKIQNKTTPLFTDGSILSVLSGQTHRKGTIELKGQTLRPGLYDLSDNKTLSKLLDSPHILNADTYPLLGTIKRWDKEQLSSTYISFPVRSVLKKEYDINLADSDIIILYSNQYISTLSDTYTYNTKEIENSKINDQEKTREIKNKNAEKKYLKEHSVHVRGAVRHPGYYPVAQGITLENLLAAAGGLTLDANKESIEITSINTNTEKFSQSKGAQTKTQRMIIGINTVSGKNHRISAGDSIRINRKNRTTIQQTVQISGEVHNPGEYGLMPGDSLHALIKRAGGLTEHAYPAGAIFSRESERRSEERRFRKAANNMQRSLANVIENNKKQPNTQRIDMVRSLALELKNARAIGRITVESDPNILSAKPELDILLEDKDHLHIPKRPLSVRVAGEVLSPSSQQFIAEKEPLDYIHEAGNFTFHADKNRTFLLYPNGRAEPLQVNAWNHKPVFIPPGSTIIVPRDPEPFSFIEGAREVAQILSNLAVTAVFIDDIRD